MSMNAKKWYNLYYYSRGERGGFIDSFERESDAIDRMMDEGEAEYEIVITYTVTRI